MAGKIRFLALIFVAIALCACSIWRGSKDTQADNEVYTPKPVVSSPYKVKVAQVYNDTHKVHDVDVVGLLWDDMEESLKKRGMLWDEKTQGEPYVLEGHVLYFKEGDMAERCVPYLGDSVLAVRVELSQGGQHLATIQSKRRISFGRGMFTRRAWNKVFREVSEDVVDQAVRKFQ
ncbi:MAG TPA: hypothetical protein VEF34_18990 [Syntrophobacteraceae bacterium]|nr:hypothetical protein [Syntrophobacteraceae bacterium]